MFLQLSIFLFNNQHWNGWTLFTRTPSPPRDVTQEEKFSFNFSWTSVNRSSDKDGGRRTKTHPPPPAPVSFPCKLKDEQILRISLMDSCPTPIAFSKFWLMSIRSYTQQMITFMYIIKPCASIWKSCKALVSHNLNLKRINVNMKVLLSRFEISQRSVLDISNVLYTAHCVIFKHWTRPKLRLTSINGNISATPSPKIETNSENFHLHIHQLSSQESNTSLIPAGTIRHYDVPLTSTVVT